MSKFNFINLSNNSKPLYGASDIQSENPKESKEKVDTFTLHNLTNNAEKNKTNKAFNFKLIVREKIKFNANNDFEIKDIDSLAESILANGLLHNLAAYYEADEDMYLLESGERRVRACDYLRERFESKEYTDYESIDYQNYIANVKELYVSGFPVNVKKKSDGDDKNRLDVIDSELRKYAANIDVREFTPQEKFRYITKIKALLDERKDLVNNKDQKMNEIPKLLGISEKQYNKYELIEHLIPALKEEFERGNLAINKIPSIAKMPVEEQELVLRFIQEGKNVEPNKIKQYAAKIDELEQEKIAIEREKETTLKKKEELERELDLLKENFSKERENIIRESFQKEQKIQEELEKAVAAQNEDRIIALQEELADERASSARLLRDTNIKLKSAQAKLEEANLKIKELEDKNNNEHLEEEIKIITEVDVQKKVLEETCKKLQKTIQKLRAYASEDTMRSLEEELGGYIQNIFLK